MSCVNSGMSVVDASEVQRLKKDFFFSLNPQFTELQASDSTGWSVRFSVFAWQGELCPGSCSEHSREAPRAD